MKVTALVLVSMILAAAAPHAVRAQTKPAAQNQSQPYVRVWLAKTGAIELDAKPGSLEAVAAAFEDLAKRKGLVVYGREAADREPHPNAVKIMDLVLRNRLPVRLSTKRDFSDVIGPDGKLK